MLILVETAASIVVWRLPQQCHTQRRVFLGLTSVDEFTSSLYRFMESLSTLIQETCAQLAQLEPPTRSWDGIVRRRNGGIETTKEVRLDFDILPIQVNGIAINLPEFDQLVRATIDCQPIAARLLYPDQPYIEEDGLLRLSISRSIVQRFAQIYFEMSKTVEYNDVIFQKAMENLLEHIFLPQRYTVVCPLMNMRLDREEVILSDEIKIRYVQDSETERWLNPPTFPRTDMPIERYTIARITCAIEITTPPGSVKEHGPDYEHNLSVHLLHLLRLITNHNVYIAFYQIQSSYSTMHHSYVAQEPDRLRMQQDVTTLDESLCMLLERVWATSGSMSSLGRLDLPLRRWSGASEKLSEEDKLIDYCISLEALFLTGARPSLISTCLNRADRKRHRSKMESTLLAYKFSNGAISRIIDRVTQTESMGTIDRIQEGLAQLGIRVTSDEVKTVVNQRGAVVHAGETLDSERVRIATGLAREWVRCALLNSLVGSTEVP
jgi:hypothetical protein